MDTLDIQNTVLASSSRMTRSKIREIFPSQTPPSHAHIESVAIDSVRARPSRKKRGRPPKKREKPKEEPMIEPDRRRPIVQLEVLDDTEVIALRDQIPPLPAEKPSVNKNPPPAVEEAATADTPHEEAPAPVLPFKKRKIDWECFAHPQEDPVTVEEAVSSSASDLAAVVTAGQSTQRMDIEQLDDPPAQLSPISSTGPEPAAQDQSQQSEPLDLTKKSQTPPPQPEQVTPQVHSAPAIPVQVSAAAALALPPLHHHPQAPQPVSAVEQPPTTQMPDPGLQVIPPVTSSDHVPTFTIKLLENYVINIPDKPPMDIAAAANHLTVAPAAEEPPPQVEPATTKEMPVLEPEPQKPMKTFLPLQCVECKVIISRPKIKGCSQGHLLCSICFCVRMAKGCSVCSEPSVLLHQPNAETELARRIADPNRPWDCQNSRFGCRTTPTSNNLRLHEALCPHRIVRCPRIHRQKLCPYKGKLKNLHGHMTTSQCASYVPLDKNTLLFSGGIKDLGSVYTILDCPAHYYYRPVALIAEDLINLFPMLRFVHNRDTGLWHLYVESPVGLYALMNVRVKIMITTGCKAYRSAQTPQKPFLISPVPATALETVSQQPSSSTRSKDSSPKPLTPRQIANLVAQKNRMGASCSQNTKLPSPPPEPSTSSPVEDDNPITNPGPHNLSKMEKPCAAASVYAFKLGLIVRFYHPTPQMTTAVNQFVDNTKRLIKEAGPLLQHPQTKPLSTVSELNLPADMFGPPSFIPKDVFLSDTATLCPNEAPWKPPPHPEHVRFNTADTKYKEDMEKFQAQSKTWQRIQAIRAKLPPVKTSNSTTQTSSLHDGPFLRGQRFLHAHTSSQHPAHVAVGKIVQSGTPLKDIDGDCALLTLTNKQLHKLKEDNTLFSFAVGLYEVNTGEGHTSAVIGKDSQMAPELKNLLEYVSNFNKWV